jgi:hypothetical protein
MLPLVMLTAAAACRPSGHEMLSLDRKLPLPAALAARTLAFDSSATLLGVAGALLRVDSTASRVLERIPLPDTTPPRVLGQIGRAYLLQQGGRILRAGPDSTVAPREAPSFGTAVAALDPRLRFVLGGAASGAVLGFDPDSLIERWSWPRLGRAATALAIAPEADQVFLALAGSAAEQAGQEIVARDAETGRTLHRGVLPWPARELRAASEGRLYALIVRGGRGAVLGLQVGPEGVRELWHRPLGRLGISGEAHLRLAPGGGRLVVFGSGERGGMAMLDAESGEPLARGREGPLDAAFDAADRLWILTPGVLGRVREGVSARSQ